MIFKKLVIENIASLKGHHEIDFSKDLFNENIFAITGPTGSGKSTILSALSTALYGEHYKGALKPMELVTLGAGHGFISLDFNYSGIDYQAQWEVKLLKNDGSPYKDPKPNKAFYQLHAHDKEKLDYRSLEDLIHLNFNQFSKTVILNQGEFNRFITSNFTERKEILEKLIDDQKLQRISEILKKEINDLDKNIENINFEIKGHTFLSEQEYSQLKEELITLETESTKNAEELEQWVKATTLLQEIAQSFSQWNQHTEKENEFTESLKLKTTTFNSFKNDSDLEQKKILSFKAQKEALEQTYRKALDLYKTQEQIKINITKSQQEIEQKQKKHKTLIEEEQQLLSKINSNLEKRNSILKLNFFKEIKDQDIQKIETLQLKFNEISNKMILLEQQANWQNDQIAKNNKELTIYSEQKTTLENTNNALAPSLFSHDGTPFAYHGEILQLNTKLQSIQNDQEFVKNLDHELLTYLNKITDLTTELNELTSEHLNKQKRSSIIDAKIKVYELALSINSCQEHSLKNKTCVVCGNHFESLPDNKYLNQAIGEDIDQALQEKRQLDEHKKLVETKIEINKSKLQDNTEKITKIKENKQTILHKYEIHHESEFTTRIQSIKNEIEICEKKKNQFDLNLGIYTTNKNKLNDSINAELKIQDENSALIHKNKEIQIEKNKLIQDREGIISDLKKNNNIDLSDSVTQLLQKNKEFHQLNYELNLQTENQKKNLNNKEELLNEITKLQSSVTSLNLDLKKAKDDVIALIGHEDPQILLDQLKKDEKEYETAERNFYNKIKAFELDIKEFETKIRLLKETKQEIEAKLKRMINELETQNHFLQKEHQHQLFSGLAENFFNIVPKIKIDIPLDQYSNTLLISIIKQNIPDELTKIKNQIQELIERKTSLATKLLIHEQKQKNIETLIKDQNKFIKEVDIKKNLYQVIGKEEFRNYVLGLVEKQLIYLANKELKTLCNERYELIQTSKRNNIPEFFIVDRFNNGQNRNIHTLSGGETFLLSLSMALGLAEMTRGKVDIQSFFIDEGFGTLDPDAIDEVLGVLLSMKNRGKQIGIISHIKYLTDRIPANIQMVKNNQGFSKIEFNYN